LEERFDMASKSREQWLRLWVDNPAWRVVPSWPIGWVLETEDKEIVGSVASVPVVYQFNGRRLIASAGRAWVCDEPHRGYALLLLDAWLSQPEADLHLGTSINANSEMAHAATGSVRVPAGRWDRAGFWITNHRRFAAGALTKRGVRAAGLLGYPLSAVTAVASVLHPSLADLSRRKHEVIALDDFDDRFDDFWEALCKRYPERLMAVRSRELMAWHFRDALEDRQVWVLALQEGLRLSAYAVFVLKDEFDLKFRRVRLVDFQSLDGDELLYPLLACALDRCRAEGIAMLENIGWQMQPGGLIERIAPHSRQLECWQYYYNAKDPELKKALAQPTAWNPSQFDGDASL
jgi:hypothetical protein